MQQIFFMMANKINCLGKQRLHQILEFEICSFLNLLSDWSIQKFWKKSFLNFWINQSEKREGKFKIEKWSNFGPRYCEIGTKIGTSNIRIVIHMVKSVSERLNRKIGDGATGPTSMYIQNCAGRSFFCLHLHWCKCIIRILFFLLHCFVSLLTKLIPLCTYVLVLFAI